MTLSRQLLLLMTGLFVLMFAGTFVISLDNSRAYLSQQLQSHAQDTATTLALSVSPHLANQDQAMVQAMVDAIFDRGYYQRISVMDNQDNTRYERSHPVRLDHVPDWFLRLIPLAPPAAEALLMSGWRQAGRLIVVSHPGYAYDELWRNAIQTLGWFAGCAVVSLSLGAVLLGRLLKPLRRIEATAMAICNREYPIQEHLPWTRELRQVVLAMNQMTARVRQLFSEEAAMAEQWHKEAYLDPVTELGNRRHFEARAAHLLNSTEEFSHGALLLLQLHKLQTYNEEHGFAAGDELLRQTAAILQKACSGVSPLVSRLNGADFAALIPNLPSGEVQALAKTILAAAIGELHPAGLTQSVDVAHIGIALCQYGDKLGETLARADQALRMAQQKGPGQFHSLDRLNQSAVQFGTLAWQSHLQQYLTRKALVAHGQPVYSLASPIRTVHYEVLLRAREADGSLTPAGAFLPMAARHSLAMAFDRQVVQLAIRNLLGQPHAHYTLAINLSSRSIGEPAFLTWLDGLIRRTGTAHRLAFEIPEYAVLQQTDVVKAFANLLISLNVPLGIDHFGLGLAAFAHLHPLKIRYLKIDGSYIRDIDQHQDHQFFVHAIAATAHEIDITVIAEAVETAAEQQMLHGLGVDAIQGYLPGRPGPLGDMTTGLG